MFITKAEFDIVYKAALKSFSQATYQELVQKLYSLNSVNRLRSRRDFLFLYALNTWIQDEYGNWEPYDNYLTPEQVFSIYSQVKQGK